MNPFRWFKSKPTEQRALTYNAGLAAGLYDLPTRSGVNVTGEAALGVSAVWCAVKVISESIGSLPLVLYVKTPDGNRDRAEDHTLAPILDNEPNPECTARVFWETFVSHCLLWGNGFIEVQRSKGGKPVALWLVHPRYVQVMRDSDTGGMVYRVNIPVGGAGEPGQVGHTVELQQADVIHVPGLSPDSQIGYNLLRIARENIGYSLALDRFGQSYFGNMANVGGVLSHPGTLSDAARENIRRGWQASYQGVEKTGTTALLEEGMTYTPRNISNEAGQYDESKARAVVDVCRLFNISPVKVHELGRATWGNLAALNTDFWGTTCRPWAEKIEAELERKLLNPGERRTLYVEFLADTLLRGSVADRYANYAIGLTAGFLTVDEVRAWENLPPLPEEAEDDLSQEDGEGEGEQGNGGDKPDDQQPPEAGVK
jgi:HK97 family phage portal protein